MDIWNVSIPILIALMVIVQYLGMIGRKIQRMGWNLAEHLVEKKGTGVSKSSMGMLRSRITPRWAAVLGWGASFASLGLLIYVAIRFGWMWAIAYVAGDHILKVLDVPILPSLKSCYSLFVKRSEVHASKMTSHLEEYREHYQHY